MSAAAASVSRLVVFRAVPGGFPVLVVLAAAVALAALVVHVLGLADLGVSLCPFKGLTGWPCASCGTTRALALLAAGDWRGALAMNPLAATLLAGTLATGLGDLVALARGRALRLSVSGPVALALRVLLPAVLVVNWLYLIAAGR